MTNQDDTQMNKTGEDPNKKRQPGTPEDTDKGEKGGHSGDMQSDTGGGFGQGDTGVLDDTEDI